MQIHRKNIDVQETAEFHLFLPICVRWTTQNIVSFYLVIFRSGCRRLEIYGNGSWQTLSVDFYDYVLYWYTEYLLEGADFIRQRFSSPAKLCQQRLVTRLGHLLSSWSWSYQASCFFCANLMTVCFTREGFTVNTSLHNNYNYCYCLPLKCSEPTLITKCYNGIFAEICIFVRVLLSTR